MEDAAIVALYWARSESALTETAEKYGPYCHTISFNILHSSEDAEECVNDTYLSAWRSMPPQRPQYLRAYLGKITRNLSLNRYKAVHAGKRGGGQLELALAELGDAVPSPSTAEGPLEEKALVEAIEAFLRSQTREKRNLFIRRYWYLDPIETLARAFGMSESKTVSLLYRMRKALKAHLEKEGITV